MRGGQRKASERLAEFAREIVADPIRIRSTADTFSRKDWLLVPR